MDSNHPIPQDVTGFQFRLIGDMTVKQFAYVAVGGIFTVISLYAPLPLLIRVPLMILFAGAGAAVAFFPVEGRPMDLMISNFLKALLTPNQYVFQKTGGSLAIFNIDASASRPQSASFPLSQHKNVPYATDKERRAKLQTYLTSIHGPGMSEADKKESMFTSHLFQVTPTPQIQTPQDPIQSVQPQQIQQTTPSAQQKNNNEEKPLEKSESVSQIVSKTGMNGDSPREQNTSLSLQENVLSKELLDAKNDENVEKDAAKKQQAHLHGEELEKQLFEIKKQKEELEKQLVALKAQSAPTPIITAPIQEPQAIPQQPQVQPIKEQQAAIRKIPSEMAKSLGLPHIPEAPNLIIGIVKDPRGNVLSNILVEVKDKDGTPARAFRTNQLGQFASATQLPNGTYNIEFEDPKGEHQFDQVEINANGEIIMPLEVISHDAREELRKALFN